MARFCGRPAGNQVPGYKVGFFCGTTTHDATCTENIAQDTPFYLLHYNFDGGDMTMAELESSAFNVWQDGRQQGIGGPPRGGPAP